MFFIQHCFICCPSDSTLSENAVIDPRTVVTSALAVRRSNHSTRSHPQSARSHPPRLDLIHSARPHPPRLDLVQEILGQSQQTHGQSHQTLGQSHQILGQSHQILGHSHQILGQSHQILRQSHQIVRRSYQIPGQSHQILGQSQPNIGTVWSNIGTFSPNIGTVSANTGQSHRILEQSYQIHGQSHQILGQPLLTSYKNSTQLRGVHASRDYCGNGRQLPYRSASPARGLHVQVCLIKDCMIVDLYSLRIKLWREWGTVAVFTHLKKINVKIHGRSFLYTKSTLQSSDKSSDLQQSLDTKTITRRLWAPTPARKNLDENSFQQSLYLNNSPAECRFHRRATSALGRLSTIWNI